MYKGSYVEIQPDSPVGSGGFKILITNRKYQSPNMKGHDSYVESLSDLGKFIQECHWSIEWNKNNFDNYRPNLQFVGEFFSDPGKYRYLGVSENLNVDGKLMGLTLFLSNSKEFDNYDQGWAESYPDLINSMREEPNWIIRWL